MADLDLERGESEEGGRGPKPESVERQSRRKRAESRRTETGIRERLFAVFSRLADSREGRGDVELAEMIREDSRAMVEGILSATKRAPGLAGVILGGLAVIEPLIAFGRIFRLMLGRVAERRYRAREDETGGEEYGGGYVEPEPEAAPEPEEESVPIAEPWRLDN